MDLNQIKELLLSIGASPNELDRYIEFCSLRNEGNRVMFEEASHHILPKSMFPEYENLNLHPWNRANLKHSDHLWAHYWLSKALPGNYGMSYAFYRMCGKQKADLESNPELADHLNTVLRMPKGPMSDEHRRKISEANTGKPRPKSEEHRKKLSEALIGKRFDEERRKGLMGPRGPMSEEQREKLRSPKTKEHALKISESKRGIIPPKFECIHCGALCSKPMLDRWHGDNCKDKKNG